MNFLQKLFGKLKRNSLHAPMRSPSNATKTESNKKTNMDQSSDLESFYSQIVDFSNIKDMQKHFMQAPSSELRDRVEAELYSRYSEIRDPDVLSKLIEKYSPWYEDPICEHAAKFITSSDNLKSIASFTKNQKARNYAINNINDDGILIDVATAGYHYDASYRALQKVSKEKIQEYLLTASLPASSFLHFALMRISNQDHIADIAINSEERVVQEAAIGRLCDNNAFGKVVKGGVSKEMRKTLEKHRLRLGKLSDKSMEAFYGNSVQNFFQLEGTDPFDPTFLKKFRPELSFHFSGNDNLYFFLKDGILGYRKKVSTVDSTLTIDSTSIFFIDLDQNHLIIKKHKNFINNDNQSIDKESPSVVIYDGALDDFTNSEYYNDNVAWHDWIIVSNWIYLKTKGAIIPAKYEHRVVQAGNLDEDTGKEADKPPETTGEYYSFSVPIANVMGHIVTAEFRGRTSLDLQKKIRAHFNDSKCLLEAPKEAAFGKIIAIKKVGIEEASAIMNAPLRGSPEPNTRVDISGELLFYGKSNAVKSIQSQGKLSWPGGSESFVRSLMPSSNEGEYFLSVIID